MLQHNLKAGTMLKKNFFPILFFFIVISSANAGPSFKTDSLLNIFGIKDKNLKVKLLVKYIKDNLLNSPINRLYASKTEIDGLLNKYNLQDKEAYKYFNEGVYLTQTLVKIISLKPFNPQIKTKIIFYPILF